MRGWAVHWIFPAASIQFLALAVPTPKPPFLPYPSTPAVSIECNFKVTFNTDSKGRTGKEEDAKGGGEEGNGQAGHILAGCCSEGPPGCECVLHGPVSLLPAGEGCTISTGPFVCGTHLRNSVCTL